MGKSRKKTVARSGHNPVPLSRRAKLHRATHLYEQFTGHAAEHIDTIQHNPIDVGLRIGECDGILYTTVRDGQTEHYIHRFKQSARPLLAASYDGATLALIGGKFNFTDRGIVDR